MAKVEYEPVQKPLFKRLIEAACVYWEVEESFFFIKKDKGCNTEKRHTLFFLLNTEAAMEFADIGKHFNYSKSSIREACDIISVRKNISLSITRDMRKINLIASNLEASIVVVDVQLRSLGQLDDSAI